mgnify:FL=1
MRNISPAFPTAREPISFRPSILALPFVAIFSISYPLGAWLLEFRRCSRKATRNSSKRFDPSLLALPSTARPTGTSSFNISGILQIPEESFMLEIGQCAHRCRFLPEDVIPHPENEFHEHTRRHFLRISSTFCTTLSGGSPPSFLLRSILPREAYIRMPRSFAAENCASRSASEFPSGNT